MIIGNFIYSKQDKAYCGSIRTLSIYRDEVLLQPVEKASEQSPDFRVILPDPNGIVEIGAAWKRIDKNKKEYLSVQLDDPARSSPLYAALLPAETGNGAILVWSRPRKKQAQAS